jgi:hypothetical protein
MCVHRNYVVLALFFLSCRQGVPAEDRYDAGVDHGHVPPTDMNIGTPERAVNDVHDVQPVPCTMSNDSVLASDAVGASWIEWSSACLPNANVVYVDHSTWNIYVMDQMGGSKRCLTCYGNNILGVNFPLDEDGLSPSIHWKGDPEVLPHQPVFLFHVENEHSEHRATKNTPSIGWDNDIWALNVCTKRYSRLTKLASGEGLQHTALADDGSKYVFPRRYYYGNPPSDFGYSKMVFNEVVVDGNGDVTLKMLSEDEPNGQMYYEPNDIHASGGGIFTLLYVAGAGSLMDPYRYDFVCNSSSCQKTGNQSLAATPFIHEEFLMFSPSANSFAFMKGPSLASGSGYKGDLYIGKSDYEQTVRITFYNDCSTWPTACLEYGGQLSRLSWSGDGKSIFFGLWRHGPLLPFKQVDLHRIDVSESCPK